MNIEHETRHLEKQLERLKDLYEVGDKCKEQYIAERDGLRAPLAALKPPQLSDLEETAPAGKPPGIVGTGQTEGTKAAGAHVARGCVPELREWPCGRYRTKDRLRHLICQGVTYGSDGHRAGGYDTTP